VSRYVIRGGKEGYDRLLVLARALGPGTERLFDRIGLRPGMHCLDLGCGGGEVSFAMAERVGSSGSVVGIDMDEVKLELGRQAAAQRGLDQVELRAGDVTRWEESEAYDLVYARTLLQHLADPVDLLRRMWRAVRPGGVLAAEDADFEASFCEPPNAGFDFQLQWYQEALRRRGGDPEIGRKLYRYCAEAGIGLPFLSIEQRVDADGDVKQLTYSTLEATGQAMVDEGVATSAEVADALASLARATEDPGTIIGLPRTFQVWRRKPAPFAA
jgi:ubiquinone/menaquinone biosynthesis C-methylase UbiE